MAKNAKRTGRTTAPAKKKYKTGDWVKHIEKSAKKSAKPDDFTTEDASPPLPLGLSKRKAKSEPKPEPAKPASVLFERWKSGARIAELVTEFKMTRSNIRRALTQAAGGKDAFKALRATGAGGTIEVLFGGKRPAPKPKATPTPKRDEPLKDDALDAVPLDSLKPGDQFKTPDDVDARLRGRYGVLLSVNQGSCRVRPDGEDDTNWAAKTLVVFLGHVEIEAPREPTPEELEAKRAKKERKEAKLLKRGEQALERTKKAKKERKAKRTKSAA